jgi:uncharacterized lipoprotein YbaY
MRVERAREYALRMPLEVEVLLDPAERERPPAGTPLRVQLRDTSLADAPAEILAEADTVVSDEGGQRLATVELPAPEGRPADRLTVWAHLDVSRTGDVTVGDYVTTQAHVAPSPEQQPARLPVTVRPVR